MVAGGGWWGWCGTPHGTLPGRAQCCRHSTLGDPGHGHCRDLLMEHRFIRACYTCRALWGWEARTEVTVQSGSRDA